MYYVLKNGNGYMGTDGMLTDSKSDALRIDPTLVQALRQGGWPNSGLFDDVQPGDDNFGQGVRIVKVNQAEDTACCDSAAPVIYAGAAVA